MWSVFGPEDAQRMFIPRERGKHHAEWSEVRKREGDHAFPPTRTSFHVQDTPEREEKCKELPAVRTLVFQNPKNTFPKVNFKSMMSHFGGFAC